jgi:hypothetical protein
MHGNSLAAYPTHVRFEVAGDGNRDRVGMSEALSTETGSNRSVLPKSWAPSPDPTLKAEKIPPKAGRDLRETGFLHSTTRLSRLHTIADSSEVSEPQAKLWSAGRSSARVGPGCVSFLGRAIFPKA